MNILYLHCHDAGRYLQPYGYPVPTPHLQRLAEEGALFRQAFTTSPTCSPSRACLLTGQHAHVNGMLGLAHFGFRLSDYSHHLIHTLHAAGYTSALAGMQHIARHAGLPQPNVEAIGYRRILTEDPHFLGPTDAAVDFLHEAHEQPFFLSVGYFAPHRGKVPHRPDRGFPSLGPPLDDRYIRPPAPLPDNPTTRRDMADYASSMQSVDQCMGRVLDALDRTGLAENTLVIATTDHGIAFPNMKCRLTDHGTGVMLIMRGPAGSALRGGKVVDAMVTHLDVFPTICDLLGIDPPDRLQGKSFMPLLRGQQDELHEAIFGEVTFHAAYEPMRTVRTKRYRYIREAGDEATTVVRNCDPSPSKTHWLAQGWGDAPKLPEQLYDLELDPNEAHSVANDPRYAEVLADLRGRLDQWMIDTDDPLLRGAVPVPECAKMPEPPASPQPA